MPTSQLLPASSCEYMPTAWLYAHLRNSACQGLIPQGGEFFGAGSPAFFHICTTGFILAGLHSAPVAPIENMTTQTLREEAKPAAALRVLFGSYALALGICSSQAASEKSLFRRGSQTFAFGAEVRHTRVKLFDIKGRPHKVFRGFERCLVSGVIIADVNAFFDARVLTIERLTSLTVKDFAVLSLFKGAIPYSECLR